MCNTYRLAGTRTVADLDPLSLGQLWGLTVLAKHILFYLMLCYLLSYEMWVTNLKWENFKIV